MRILLLSIILFCSLALSAESISYTSTPSLQSIEQYISKPLPLIGLSCSADIVFCAEEFRDITNLSIGQEITAQILHRAIKNLFQKNKFERITVSYTIQEGGLNLSFRLVGSWTFQSLSISGIWVGRDWYKQYYLMESGDIFEPEKHKHSMQKIEDICARDGFFNATTETVATRNHRTKTVDVHTKITKGKRFSLRDITLELVADESVPSEMLQRLKKRIYKKFLKGLHHYSKPLLEEQTRAIKKFLAYEGFLDVTIILNESLNRRNHTVGLTWQINLHKKRTFVFFGNHFFSNYQLLDRMLEFGRSAWILPASMLAQEIERAYHKKGFWSATIDARQEADRSFFVIKEGMRATIDAITIHNASVIPERILKKKCFGSLTRARYFDQALLDSALEQLIEYYLHQGFLHISIVGHEFVPLEKFGSYRLVITIDEGIQTCIDSVSIPDFPALEKKGPFLSMRKKSDAVPFDTGMIQTQKKWLRSYFQKQGYLYPTITPELKKQDDETQHFIWHIQKGELFRFGKTIIQGSHSFPYTSIMRALEYEEGQLWDQEKIRRSFLRLKDLQLFDSVSFVPLPAAEDGTRPLLIKVHEDTSYELRARSGLEFQDIRQYQTFGGLAYRVGGTLMVKNPSNNGDLIRVDADVAKSHRELSGNYRYPWIFNVPLDGLLQGYSIKYDQPGFIGSKKNLYTLFQNGLLCGIRHKQIFWDVGVNLGFEIARTKIAKDDAQTRECARALACAMNFDPELLNKRIPFVYVEPTIIIDLLDNNLDPTRGIFSLLSLKGMLPTNDSFWDSYFVKILVEHSCFAPMGPVVGALRVRFGHIFHRQFCDIMPNERFYLGGAHSVRSYEADQVPPLGCFVDCDGRACLVPRGGKTMLNVNAELRIPLFERLRLVLFQDLGVLSGDNFAEFKAKNFVGGTGFGFRFATPIGPLRFDIAWKWKKYAPEEPRYNWFLTFGQAF